MVCDAHEAKPTKRSPRSQAHKLARESDDLASTPLPLGLVVERVHGSASVSSEGRASRQGDGVAADLNSAETRD